MKKRLFILSLFAVLGLPAAATAQTDCVTIKAVTAFLPDGKKETVDVLFRGRKIFAVGPNAANHDKSSSGWCPGNNTVISGKGRTLTAGFVEPYSQLGLVEVSLEASTADAHAVTHPKLKKPIRDKPGRSSGGGAHAPGPRGADLSKIHCSTSDHQCQSTCRVGERL